MAYYRSEIAFSQVREDPSIEIHLIQKLAQQKQKKLRVFVVASGGCTSLSLLSCPEIADIIAVDINSAQLHLVELRRQCLLHLTLPEQYSLIGITDRVDNLETAQQHRLELYQQLRSHLPLSTRIFWDHHLEDISLGVNRSGRFEHLFRELAERFASMGIYPLDHPSSALEHPLWQETFHHIFEREKLSKLFGEAAVNYSMDRSFGEHFADVFSMALRRFEPQHNYFLTQVWSDRYPANIENYPLYLQPTVQDKILCLGCHRLSLRQGKFLEVLEKEGQNGKFDLIQFSNISDWMPIPVLEQMLSIARQYLQPHGWLLGRRLNGDHQLATIMNAYVKVDETLSYNLLQKDRSFFYQEIVAGHKES